MPHLRTRSIVAYLAVVMPTSRQRCERHLLRTRIARVVLITPFIEWLHPFGILLYLSLTLIISNHNRFSVILIEHVFRWHSPPLAFKVKIVQVEHPCLVTRPVNVSVVAGHVRYNLVDVEHQPLAVDLFVNIALRIFCVNVIQWLIVAKSLCRDSDISVIAECAKQ